MQIMIVSYTYYPDINGIQFVTQFLAEKLAEKNHEITVLVKSNEPTGNELYHGVKIERISDKRKSILYNNMFEFQKRIQDFSVKGDLVIFVGFQSITSNWAFPNLTNMQCKVLIYMHGMHCFRWKKVNFISSKEFVKKCVKDIYWGIYYYKSRNAIKKFDGVIHLHKKDYSYQYFTKHKLSENYALYNFAENMFFEQKNNYKSNIKNYIYISNYHEGKNQLMLLKAFYLLKDSNIRLTCIGSVKNSYLNKLVNEEKKLAALYGKKEVDLLYQVPRNKLPDYLKRAYVFVMPSLREAFPITIIEAMAAGVPFISTDVGINRYLPGGKIVEPNVEALRDEMQYILNNPGVRNTMSKEALCFAQKYLSEDAYIKKAMEIIDNVIMGEIDERTKKNCSLYL